MQKGHAPTPQPFGGGSGEDTMQLDLVRTFEASSSSNPNHFSSGFCAIWQSAYGVEHNVGEPSSGTTFGPAQKPSPQPEIAFIQQPKSQQNEWKGNERRRDLHVREGRSTDFEHASSSEMSRRSSYRESLPCRSLERSERSRGNWKLRQQSWEIEGKPKYHNGSRKSRPRWSQG